MQRFHVIIVGFGLSAIPLVRELERTGAEFICISETGDTIWDSLSASGRLDFDLVSDYQTSFFSFDMVSHYERDYHPTADEFYAMRLRLQREYGRKVVRDKVVRVDNLADHSVISTASGNTLQASHVVLATGFQRSINADLNEIDYGASNQTFVFDTMGDSANLMISKLVPNNNKIIVRTNGFTPVDKVLAIGPPEQREDSSPVSAGVPQLPLFLTPRLRFSVLRPHERRGTSSVSAGRPVPRDRAERWVAGRRRCGACQRHGNHQVLAHRPVQQGIRRDPGRRHRQGIPAERHRHVAVDRSGDSRSQEYPHRLCEEDHTLPWLREALR